jgi:hypothetical protein
LDRPVQTRIAADDSQEKTRMPLPADSALAGAGQAAQVSASPLRICQALIHDSARQKRYDDRALIIIIKWQTGRPKCVKELG